MRSAHTWNTGTSIRSQQAVAPLEARQPRHQPAPASPHLLIHRPTHPSQHQRSRLTRDRMGSSYMAATSAVPPRRVSSARPQEVVTMQLRAIPQRPMPTVPVAQAVLVATIVAAWPSLLALERSPYGEIVGHAAMHGSPGRGTAQDSQVSILATFTASWTLMVVAMMLPLVMPLVMRLLSSMALTGNSTGMLLLLPVGYVLAWTVAGVGAHLALQMALGAVRPASGVSLLLGPAALVLAGAYQISPLKRRAVHRSCSTPNLAPLFGESRLLWARVLTLGLREGAVCIGCCWALMLLMLVGLAGGSGGMLVLGIIMYAEKNAPWGRRLVVPLGLFLIGLGVMFGWGSLLGVITL